MLQSVPSPSATPTPPPAVQARLLLVEDDRMSQTVLQSELSKLGYLVETANNGAEAYTAVRDDPHRYDVVVTDRMMPVMDGLALTRRLKRDADTANIPIVLLTGATATEDISAGLEAGAFYYLTKPLEPALAKSVLNSALAEVNRHKATTNQLSSHQAGFKNIQVLRMVLREPREVDPVCSLLASMHDKPEAIIQGIYELVQNGVEHGVLRFGLEAKSQHLATGTWEDALAQRSRDPSYANGSVTATMIRRDEALILSVKDTGPGFNWRSFINADPARSSARCGRGIARSNSFIFNKMAFNEAGNEVTASISLEKSIKW